MIEASDVLIRSRGNRVKIAAKQPRSRHDGMKVVKLGEEGQLVGVTLRPINAGDPPWGGTQCGGNYGRDVICAGDRVD